MGTGTRGVFPAVSANARHACINVVTSCLRGEDLQAAINRTLAESGLNESDKKLVTKIAYGYLRSKTRIEFILARTVKGKLKKLPFGLVVCLGLAVYELHYLRVPEYATVHWYVEYVKRRFSTRMGKLANGVLRGVIRWGDAAHDPEFFWHGTSSRATFLARYYACPGWIVRMWRDAYGEDACRGLLAASLRPPHTGIRVNRTLPEAEKVYAALAEEVEHPPPQSWGMALAGSPSVSLADLEDSGQISRQSFAVQLLLAELEPAGWPVPIWDACAGRVGKTTALAESVDGPIWASDLSRDKIRGLHGETGRLLLPGVPGFVHDAASTHCLRRQPGTILLDAPCSGLGVLSRRPDIKHKRTPKEIERLTRIQRDMLGSSLETLPEGGTMIYVTCTLNPEENELAIRDFLSGAGNGVGLERSFSPAWQGVNEFFYAAVLHRPKA